MTIGRHIRVGQDGSRDWLIVRAARPGVYVSVRLFRRRVWVAFGPRFGGVKAGLR